MSETSAVRELDAGTRLAMIEAVRERLGNRERWTRFVSARDGAGEACGIRDPGARRWCLGGAIALEANERFDGIGGGGPKVQLDLISGWYDSIAELLEPAIARILSEKHRGEAEWTGPIEAFNDRSDWEDVVDALDETLAWARDNLGKGDAQCK